MWLAFAPFSVEGTHLFCLKKLHASISLPNTAAFLFFLAPSIKNLTLDICNPYNAHHDGYFNPSIHALLQILAVKLPDVSILSLEGLRRGVYSDMLRPLSQFRSLTYVKIEEQIPISILQMLSMSEGHLHTLDICPTFADNESQAAVGQFGTGLSSVSCLRLRSNISDIAPLLRAMPLPALEKLYIAPKSMYTLEGLRAAGPDMTSIISPQVLLGVMLTFGICGTANTKKIHFQELYEPFSTFNCLISFSVTFAEDEIHNTVINICDADLRSAIIAWPRLEEFEISKRLHPNRYSGGDPSVTPTISGLADVAQGWCSLKTLILPWFNTAVTASPTMGANRAISGTPHPLRELRLGRLVGAVSEWSIMKLAFTLDALFPQLGAVSSEQLDTLDVAQWRQGRYLSEGLTYTTSDIICMFVAAVRSGRTRSLDL